MCLFIGYFFNKASSSRPSETTDGDGSTSCKQPRYDTATTMISDVLTKVKFGDLGLDKPMQPLLRSYPVTVIGKTKRLFLSKWFHESDNKLWLEYSQKADKAFCFVCRKFALNGDPSFTTSGFKGWNKAVERFKMHKVSMVHVNAMTAMHDYQN